MLAVISGGSQGLGYALAKKYKDIGYDVVLVARTELKLRAAAHKLGVRYIRADCSDPDECARVFEQLAVPDLVVCCAGAAHPGMFLDLDPADLKTNLDVVYCTALYFSQAAMRVMAAAHDKLLQRRQIIYCSSTVAVFPFAGYAAYAPAKAAIRALSDIVRQECLPHNIRVSHILPGSMDTEGYAIEESIKPALVKRIEGPSAAISAQDAADIVFRQLENGEDTVYTDTVSWVLGSMMLGTSPRWGFGILQSLVGILLVLFGPVVRWFIDRDVMRDVYSTQQAKTKTKTKSR